LGSAIIGISGEADVLDTLRILNRYYFCGKRITANAYDDYHQTFVEKMIRSKISTELLDTAKEHESQLFLEKSLANSLIEDTSQDTYESGQSIKLFNLPYDMTEKAVAQALVALNLRFLKVIMNADKRTGKAKGTATVHLDPRTNVSTAVQVLIKQVWCGRSIRAERYVLYY